MTTERAFGQHSLNSVANHLVDTTLACAELGRCIEALTAWIASISCVKLVSFLLTCENYFFGIDNNYIVSTINVRYVEEQIIRNIRENEQST